MPALAYVLGLGWPYSIHSIGLALGLLMDKFNAFLLD
jgi:hypothetical protein